MKIFLASTSVNRQNLFDRLGVPYQVQVPQCDEIIDPQQDTKTLVQSFAEEKARSVWEEVLEKTSGDFLIMGFDSMICFEGESIGKAKDEKAVKELILRFSGKKQEVLSGFCLLGRHGEKIFTIKDVESSLVYFREGITEDEIDTYIEGNDWQGKCGAYSILGRGLLFLDQIEGDFQNIVGVPVTKIIKSLQKELGISPFDIFYK